MCAPSRVSVLCVLVLAAGASGCGGSADPPASEGSGAVVGPALRGIEARRNRAPSVLAAVERAVGADDVIDLTFEDRRFTVMTSWVTQEQHDRPANALESDAEVRRDSEVAKVCRAVRRADPDADAFVAAYDNTSWKIACPQNGGADRRR